MFVTQPFNTAWAVTREFQAYSKKEPFKAGRNWFCTDCPNTRTRRIIDQSFITVPFPPRIVPIHSNMLSPDGHAETTLSDFFKAENKNLIRPQRTCFSRKKKQILNLISPHLNRIQDKLTELQFQPARKSNRVLAFGLSDLAQVKANECNNHNKTGLNVLPSSSHYFLLS